MWNISREHRNVENYYNMATEFKNSIQRSLAVASKFHEFELFFFPRAFFFPRDIKKKHRHKQK